MNNVLNIEVKRILVFSISILILTKVLQAQCSTWLVSPQNTCENQSAFLLTGGNPSPGTYVGTSVIGNTFNPFLAGVGSHKIGYVAASCSDTSYKFITVNPKPVLSWVSNPTSTPNPPFDSTDVTVFKKSSDTVAFSWSSSANVFVRPSGFNYSKNPNHAIAYLFPNTSFRFYLISFGSNGCLDTNIVDIKVGDTCVAFFSKRQARDSNNNYIPSNVVISDSSIGSNLSYHWDFGDNSSSTLKSPSHTYAGNGPYNLCLTINSGNCSDTYCQSISVDSSGMIKKSATGFTIHVGGYGAPNGIDKNESLTFSIYPNPSKGQLIINNEEISIERIEIMNILGEVVLSQFGLNNEKPIIDFPASAKNGIYFVRLTSQTAIFTKRIVLSR